MSNFTSRVTGTIPLQQNVDGKLLKICKKVMSIVDLDKNQLKLVT